MLNRRYGAHISELRAGFVISCRHRANGREKKKGKRECKGDFERAGAILNMSKGKYFHCVYLSFISGALDSLASAEHAAPHPSLLP